jgi:hypothetical protein
MHLALRAIAVAVVVGVGLVGCRAAPPRPAGAFQPAAYPADFALTWRTPRGDAAGDTARWYVVDAAGVLRLTRGPGQRWRGLPPTLIRLTDAERSALWSAIVRTGMLDAPAVPPSADRHAVELVARGQTMRRAVSPGDEASLAPLRTLDALVAAHAVRP